MLSGQGLLLPACSETEDPNYLFNFCLPERIPGPLGPRCDIVLHRMLPGKLEHNSIMFSSDEVVKCVVHVSFPALHLI